LAGVLFFYSCQNEKSDALFAIPCSAVTYSQDVVPIINKHCAISGCNVTGFPSGDFTTYDGLHQQVENGFFRLKVLEQSVMQPNGDSFSDNDLMILQCRVNNGVPDN